MRWLWLVPLLFFGGFMAVAIGGGFVILIGRGRLRARLRRLARLLEAGDLKAAEPLADRLLQGYVGADVSDIRELVPHVARPGPLRGKVLRLVAQGATSGPVSTAVQNELEAWPDADLPLVVRVLARAFEIEAAARVLPRMSAPARVEALREIFLFAEYSSDPAWGALFRAHPAEARALREGASERERKKLDALLGG